ncbi:MAG: DUF169 domain-containing protein [Thermodesulfobacteriota bacterium]
MNQGEAAEFLSNDLRLKTFPIALKFFKDKTDLPEKSRRPSEALGKRITICQAVTMARVYGWTMGLAKEDLICVPAMITFGFTRASDQRSTIAKLFCDVTFGRDLATAQKETASMSVLPSGEYPAMAMAPVKKASFEADTIAVYGNPAQIMRLIQAWVFTEGERITGNFGGKVECTEYLIAPFLSQAPRVAIPGNGDRIFSMTQDEELVLSFPGSALERMVSGLKEAGKKLGARYPITFYQNFQPEFPKIYKQVGEEVGAF